MKLSLSVWLSITWSLSLLGYPLLAADLSPTLEVLPLNSTLSKVTIPRYNQKKQRVAFLKADLMEVLADGTPREGRQAIMVDCTGIQLRMLTSTSDEILVDMEQARYRLTPGVLTAQDKITAISSRFSIVGHGAIFHLDSRRGFLFGPLSCQIYSKPQPQAALMTRPTIALLASIATSSFSFAEPSHRPPNPHELLEVERLSLSSRPSIQEEEEVTQALIRDSSEESTTADNLLKDFAQTTESESLNLLIKDKEEPSKATSSNEQTLIKDPSLTIHCDGGGFFDGNKNLLVFLRNVVVTEPRFTLKANKEIKVFFNTNSPTSQKETGEEKQKLKSPQIDIDNVKSLIATGGINFSGIDKDGNPVEASAETALYDDLKKTLILKDGNPTFWTKKGELEVQLQSEQQGASIRIELSDNGLQAHTSENGWTFGGKNLPLKK